jgi:hypothetical protein
MIQVASNGCTAETVIATMPTRALRVLTSPHSEAAALAIERAASFLGLEAQRSVLSSPLALDAALATLCTAERHVLVVSGDLLRAEGGAVDLAHLRQVLPDSISDCLVLDLTPATASPRTGVCRRVPSRYSISETASDVLGPLTGLTGAHPARGPVPTFSPPGASHALPLETLVSVDGHPVFMLDRAKSCSVYLWITDDVPDVESLVDQDIDLADLQLRLVPLLVFLRGAFGAACWHAAQPMARLTIDDPLLQPRYGFLRYNDLVESLQRTEYGLSIAFIPSNHRRSSPALVRQLSALGSRFGICAHGCDHTNHEYAYLDEPAAHALSEMAIERLRQHQNTHGFGWDPVMIFPQGQFSAASTAGLEAAGFLAAVNSTCFPHEDASILLSMSDLLAPAVTNFAGFPVMRRRDPDDLFGFAVDLFVGRPALVCEHHQFFKEGFDRLERLVRSLHRMEPALTWPSLTDIAMRACRQKVTANGYDVIVYGQEFVWRNPSDSLQCVRFMRHDPRRRVRGARAGQVDLRWQHNGPHVVIVTEVPAHAVIHCRLNMNWEAAPQRPALGRSHALRVLLRRRLSELRDNWSSQSPALLSLAERVAQALKATSQS